MKLAYWLLVVIIFLLAGVVVYAGQMNRVALSYINIQENIIDRQMGVLEKLTGTTPTPPDTSPRGGQLW